jgi:hypothetical protein
MQGKWEWRRTDARAASRIERGGWVGRSVDVDDGDVIQLGLVDVAEVELTLRGSTGGGFAGRLGRQTEVAEDALDGLGMLLPSIVCPGSSAPTRTALDRAPAEAVLGPRGRLLREPVEAERWSADTAGGRASASIQRFAPCRLN